MITLQDIDPERLAGLSTYSMEKFCDGYRMMFDQKFTCKLVGAELLPVDDLKSKCGEFIAVNAVSCVGAVEGRFVIVLDKEALFTLGGSTVMLPAPRIKELRDKGTAEDISYIDDAIREVGNLLVGEYAIGFRIGSNTTDGFGDGAYLKLDLPVPIGSVDVSLENCAVCNLLIYEMEINEFGPFKVYVAFPLPE